MILSAGTSRLKQTRWYEVLLRFTLGGLVTAGACALAKVTGQSFAGLFLAFPAILAASTTLVAKHECQRKQSRGQKGDHRGRQAAGADAAGAALGSLGLIAFALIAWQLFPLLSAWLVIPLATFAWAALSFLAWWTWKRLLPRPKLHNLQTTPHMPSPSRR